MHTYLPNGKPHLHPLVVGLISYGRRDISSWGQIVYRASGARLMGADLVVVLLQCPDFFSSRQVFGNED